MNLKFLKSLLRYTIAAVVVGFFVVLNGCDDDDGPTIFNGTVVELIQSDEFKQATNGDATKSLDSLVKYLSLNPDLVALVGTSPEVTLFAPSNTAFVNLLATPGFPSNIADINPDIIKGVLAYHVVSSKALSGDVTAGASFVTNYKSTNACTGVQTDQAIEVNTNGTLKTGSTNQDIDIVVADKQAANGVVHVVESVMIPPATGASLTPILGKLAATVLLGADFTILARFMTKADCGVSGVTPLSNVLAGPDTSPLTAFLPPNVVFEGTAAEAGVTVDQLLASFSAAQCRQIILNHVVSGSVARSALTNGAQLTTLLDAAAKLNVTVIPSANCTPGASATNPYCTIFSTSGGSTSLGGTTQAPLLVPDIAHSNGVGHVVGKILIPN
ncbi:MAG: fasciclin domain-containing protein [Cyclobacteriaceae bacterium]